MIRDRRLEFSAPESGRVDRVSASLVPRSVFSLPDVLIFVDGKKVKKSQRVEKGQQIELSWKEEVFSDLEAEDIPLDVIYEDDSILVINKASGMVVHPAAGNWSGTLVNALLHRYGEDFSTCAEGDDEDSSLRPGIVHRLDKDTSGVMIIAKTAQAMKSLAGQFASHTNEKIYVCLVKGHFNAKRGLVGKNIVRSPHDRKTFTVTDDRSRGKTALTHYTVLRQTDDYAFVRIRIETGRTHQIRVHMKSTGHPVVGDSIYSRPDRNFPHARLCLHSLSLTISHPVTGERMNFIAPLDAAMKKILKQVFAQRHAGL